MHREGWAVVRARVDRLGVEEAEVLRLAAVVGAEIPVRLLERLTTAPERLPAVLERLEAADMLLRVDGPGEPLYRFRHAIIQEAARETLPPGARRELHARVGEALEALDVIRLAGQLEALAHHFGRGGRFEKAALYAEKAGDRAACSYALEEARGQYEQALEFLSRLEQTPERLRRRVDVAIKRTEVSLYQPMARQLAVLGECHDIARRIGYAKGAARCGYWMGWIQYALGNQAEAVWHFERILPVARDLGDERLVAQLQLNIGQSYAAATEYRRAREHLDRGLSRLGTSSPGTEAAYAFGHLGMLYGDQGHFELGYQYLEEALRITRALGRRSVEGAVLTQLAIVQLWQGDWVAGLETVHRARQEAERMGAPSILAMCRMLEGHARFQLTGGAEPLALLREAVRWLEDNETRFILSWNQACLAEALVLSDQVEEASFWAHQALARSLTWDRRGEAMAHRVLGLVAARGQGANLARARMHLEQSIEVARNKDSPREEALSRWRIAELLREAGRADEARRQLELALPRFVQMGMAWHRERAGALLRSLAVAG
jgi:tetratricopeptide (TPR) repeat protein